MPHDADRAPEPGRRTGSWAPTLGRRFLAFQAVVWLLFGAVNYALYYFAVEPDRRIGMLRWDVVRLLGGILLTSLIAVVVMRQLRRGVGPRRLVGTSLALSVLLSGPWLLLLLGIGRLLGRGGGMPSRYVGPWLGEHAVILLAWTAGFLATVLWGRSRALEREAFEIRDQAQQAKLDALSHQIRPHFLFNSLNSLRALIADDNTQARDMVTGLAEFLRYTIATRPGSLVELGREVEALERYLEIERRRFGEQLRFELSVEPEAATVRVPELLLLPLVENAVTHGLTRTDGAIEVGLTACRRNGAVEITVSNSGLLDDGGGGSGLGVGLENVGRRLALHYPQAPELAIRQRENRVQVRLEIPLDES